MELHNFETTVLKAVDCRALWFEALAGTVAAFLAVQDRLVVMKRAALNSEDDPSTTKRKTLL